MTENQNVMLYRLLNLIHTEDEGLAYYPCVDENGNERVMLAYVVEDGSEDTYNVYPLCVLFDDTYDIFNELTFEDDIFDTKEDPELEIKFTSEPTFVKDNIWDTLLLHFPWFAKLINRK